MTYNEFEIKVKKWLAFMIPMEVIAALVESSQGFDSGDRTMWNMHREKMEPRSAAEVIRENFKAGKFDLTLKQRGWK